MSSAAMHVLSASDEVRGSKRRHDDRKSDRRRLDHVESP